MVRRGIEYRAPETFSEEEIRQMEKLRVLMLDDDTGQPVRERVERVDHDEAERERDHSPDLDAKACHATPPRRWYTRFRGNR